MLNSSSMRDIYAKSENPSLPGMSLFNAMIILLIVVTVKKI